MPSASDYLIESDIRRAVLLRRLENSVIDDMLAGFGNLENSIITEILKRGETVTARELQALIKSMREIQAAYFETFVSGLNEHIDSLIMSEVMYNTDILDNLIPAIQMETLASVEAVRRSLNVVPIQVGRNGAGLLLKELLDTLSRKNIETINGIVRNGFIKGETLDGMVQAIRGLKTNNFKDGAMEGLKRDARGVIRTALNHTSNQAKLAVWQDNDAVVGWRFLAVLDSRTSQICMAVSSLDKVYKKDDLRNYPPLHINCRSQATAVLDDRYNVLREGGTQSSEFGRVDADLTYFEWLKRQKPDYIRDKLGPKMSEVFIKKGMTAKKFAQLNLDKRFQPLTIEEMKKKQVEDFKDLLG